MEESLSATVLTVPEFNVAYQNNLREIYILLFNVDEMNPMIDETAAIIDTPADGLDGRCRSGALDFNPILVSPYVSDDRHARQVLRNLAQPRLHRYGTVAQRLRCKPHGVDRQGAAHGPGYPRNAITSYAGPAGYPADQLLMRASGFWTRKGPTLLPPCSGAPPKSSGPGWPTPRTAGGAMKLSLPGSVRKLTTYAADIIVPRRLPGGHDVPGARG